MIYVRQKRLILSFIFGLFFFSPFCFSQEVAKDSVDPVSEDEQLVPAQGQTFYLPFAVGHYSVTSNDKHFYVVAHAQTKKGEGIVNELAISHLYKGTGALAFIPLAKEKAHIDFEFDQDNPAFDAGIKHFSLLEDKRGTTIIGFPVFVTSEQPCKIYAFDQISLEKCLLVGSTEKIKDANVNDIANIENIAPGPQGMVFAAVTGNGSDEFGNPGSGIAVFKLSCEEKKDPAKEEQDEKVESKQDESEEVKKQRKLKVSLPQVTGKALSLDKASGFIKIGEDLESLCVSDMYWCNNLNSLFIALQVKAGPNQEDGARALVVGRMEQVKVEDKERTQFVLRPIVSGGVFSEHQNEIIGAIGSGSEVSLHKVRTMHSSNGIHYAIVVGANGSPSNTKRSVHALPLIDWKTEDPSKGIIAYKGSIAEDVFGGSNIKALKHRSLRKIAHDKEALITSEDPAAQVGGGLMPYGDIHDLFVFSDAVFVVVGNTESYKKSGIYMSRALFDERGNIKRWSDWKNVFSSNETIFGAHLDASFGTFTVIKGKDANNINSIEFTSWGSGSENGLRDLTTQLSQEFPRDFDGIQGLHEFPSLLAGLDNMTLLVATGFKKIALVDMGSSKEGEHVRTVGDFSTDKQIFNSGKITRDFPSNGSKLVVISGGVLDEIGPIKASALSVTDSGRLFVGGVGGVAVLVDETNGQGWDSELGLGSRFKRLKNGMVFKKVGDFRFVRKLIAQGPNLYLLTDTGLYRIDVSDEDNNFLTGRCKTVQLASITTIEGLGQYGTLLDFVVSQNLGLLATSGGLFRVGDWQDISHDEMIDWTKVAIPSYQGPVQQLVPISASGIETDFAKEGKDGMLYVLGANYSKDRAQLNRFTVKAGPVTSSTILPLPDYFVEVPGKGVGSHSYFVNFGSFRKAICYDGALRFGIKNSDLDELGALSLLPKGIKVRSPLPVAARTKMPIGLRTGDDIVTVFRSFMGPVLVAGNFGLKVNE